MKTNLILILLLTLSQLTLGQEEASPAKKNKIWIGAIYSPRAFNTFDGGKPFEVASVLYFAPTYKTGNWAFSPFYNFNENRTGIFTSYHINKKLGVYIFGDQSLSSNFGAYGAGITTPVYEDWINGFIEMGGSRGINPKTAFLVGFYISLGKTLNTW